MKDLLRNTIKEQEETNDKFDTRLRKVFSIMKHIPGIEKWHVWLMENGAPNPWEQDKGYYSVEIANTLRIFGSNIAKAAKYNAPNAGMAFSQSRDCDGIK